jgi:hypothetical protein
LNTHKKSKDFKVMNRSNPFVCIFFFLSLQNLECNSFLTPGGVSRSSFESGVYEGARFSATAAPSQSQSTLEDALYNEKQMLKSGRVSFVGYGGEVVGATGRIGSFLHRCGGNMVSVSRDMQPGSLTDRGCPIFVAIPATEIPKGEIPISSQNFRTFGGKQTECIFHVFLLSILFSQYLLVIERTAPERRNDLVFITNGIPSDFLQLGSHHQLIDEKEITTSVPYFGVLGVGADVVTSDASPKTIINSGKHSQALADVLESAGIQCEIVDGVKEVDAAAIKKLIWVSSMWLLCHDSYEGNPPITVAQVHEQKDREMEKLLEELLPAANHLLKKYHQGEGPCGDVGSISEVKKHLEDYSSSIPSAIVAKGLSIAEFKDRNGYLLSMEKAVSSEQSLHRNLIQNVVGYIPEY